MAGERTASGVCSQGVGRRRYKEEPDVSHFKDKVAIVRGGASVIGWALCEELGQRGARVI